MSLTEIPRIPRRRKALTEPVAEGGITGVRRAWPETVAGGLTPAGLADVLKRADDGDFEAFMQLAEEMEERDPHYASVMGQRKRAISGIAPMVIPASESADDLKIAEAVETHLVRHDGFPKLVEDLMDAVGKGFSIVEIIWRPGQIWAPREFVWRPQRFFQVDRETGRELRLRDDNEMLDGLVMPPFRFIRHDATLKSGHLFRGGAARVVAFSWMCKAYTVKDWAAFVERYGLPLRIGRYGAEATTKDVQTLFRAVANIGTDAAAVIPRHMDIELTEVKSGGGEKPVFENLARYVDEQISKMILGQTMTTDDGSSMAQAQVHNDVRHDIAAADARQVSAVLRRDLVGPFVALNYGETVQPPRLVIEVSEPEDVAAKVKAVTELAREGVTFSSSWARRIVGAEDPEDGEDVFGGTTPAPTPPGTAREVRLARADTPEDELDEIAEEMLDGWEPVMNEIMGPLLAAIDGAESYEDAIARLDNLPGLPSAELIDALVKGMFKARALGDLKDG